MPYIMLNHKPVAAESAVVSVQDRGFRYGDGVFETIAVHHGTPWRLDWHLARLERGLLALHIEADIEDLSSECAHLLALNEIEEGLLRIQITRGIGSRGYLPDPSHPLANPTMVIETMPLLAPPQDPVSLWQSQWKKPSPDMLPTHAKLSQGVNSTLARMEAQEHDCFEALQVNDADELCETSSGNIFWLQDGTLYTPSLDTGCLEGSMRAAIMALSPWKVQETRAPLKALAGAEAVLITNVAWKVLPVHVIHPSAMHFKSEAAASQLRTLVEADIKRWLESPPVIK